VPVWRWCGTAWAPVQPPFSLQLHRQVASHKRNMPAVQVQYRQEQPWQRRGLGITRQILPKLLDMSQLACSSVLLHLQTEVVVTPVHVVASCRWCTDDCDDGSHEYSFSSFLQRLYILFLDLIALQIYMCITVLDIGTQAPICKINNSWIGG
jgi:hypothetical protein